MKTKRMLILSGVLLLAVAGGLWWWQVWPAQASSPSSLNLTGVIETRRVRLATEIAGQVQAVLVEEGQQVSAGQVLAQIDTALLEAQLEQARAGVAVAEANLAQLEAGARAEEVAAAQAAVEQARAVHDGAAKDYENALRILNNPQELEAQVVRAQAERDSAQRLLDQLLAGSRPEDIAAAEAALAQAQAGAQTVRDQLSAAKTQAESAVEQAANALRQAQQAYSTAYWQYQYVLDTGNDPIQQQIQDPRTGQVSDNKLNDFQKQQYKDRLDAAELAVQNAAQALQQAQVAAENARQAEVTGIQTAEAQSQAMAATLDKLRQGPTEADIAVAQTTLTNAQRALDVAWTMRDNPQHLQAAADAAQAQLAAAESQLAQAQARLELVQAGARAEQIQAAEAQIVQARAIQHQIEVQIAKATITAPQNGVVLARSIEPGQTVAPGATLLELGRLDRLELAVYVPEERFGTMAPGQVVTVEADAYPGRTFTGTILRLANQAEFTPTYAQTKEDRSRLVYEVMIGLDNPDLALKPGMFAEVTFGQ